MPSFADAATDAEMWDLANYVVSLARNARLTLRRTRSGDVVVLTDDRRSLTWITGSLTASSICFASVPSPGDRDSRASAS